jgi:hypothetical protein
VSKTINPNKMSKFDRQYLVDRGIDPDEYAEKYELNDYGELVPREDGPSDGELNQADVDEPEDESYSTWDAKELQAEIAKRNEGRDEENQIAPEGTGKDGRLRKADLVAALEADDEANADGDDEDAS